MREVLKDPHELLVFVVVDQRVVATSQATLLKTLPDWQVVINNVVTTSELSGHGLGRLAMETLEQAVKIRWGEPGGKTLKLSLINSPMKKNGGFYKALGWTACNADSSNPTVVWVKQL